MEKCFHCGAALEGDELICPQCLSRLPTPNQVSQGSASPEYTASPSLPKPGIGATLQQIPWRRLLLLISLLAALFVVYLMWETFFHVSAAAHLQRGQELYDQGHFEEALSAYRLASQAEPSLAEAHEGAGWCNYQIRQDDAAVAEFRQAIAAEPNRAGAHRGLGQALYYLGRYDEAEEALRRATELTPKQTAAHAYLGSVYFVQQRYNEAIPPLKEAVAQDPTDGDSLEFLGRAYFELGQTEAALGPLVRAQALKPRDKEVLQYLTLTQMARGDYEQASESAWQLLVAEPFNPRYHLYLGQSLYEMGNLSEAEGQFREALLWMQTQGIDGTAYYYLGQIAYQNGRYDEAAQALETSLLFAPERPETHGQLGWSYVHLARCDLARPAFEAALALNPEMASAAEGLEACP